MICNGCLKEIDPAFDSVSRDARDRPWHTTCWVRARGPQDQPGVEASLPLVSPALFVGVKAIDRFQLRRRARRGS